MAKPHLRSPLYELGGDEKPTTPSTILTPTSAHSLVLNESNVQNIRRHNQDLTTGYFQVDDELLLGGFSRGTVAGFSAEDDNKIGLTMSFEIIIRSIFDGHAQMALIVTPSSSAATLRLLQQLATMELTRRQAKYPETSCTVSECLSKVFISCIFDMDGVWQIFAELEGHISQRPTQDPPLDYEEKCKETEEIQDSDDDDSASLGSASSSFSNRRSSAIYGEKIVSADQKVAKGPPSPDIIVISGFSSLSTSLFAQRERSAAHTSLSLLSIHLRHLARSLPSKPLIIIHNSTTSDAVDGSSTAKQAFDSAIPLTSFRKDLDPTLTSIFSSSGMLQEHYKQHLPRYNKPKFGLIFSQFLDIHLLFARIRTTSTNTPEKTLGVNSGSLSTVRNENVVEVLLDQLDKHTEPLGRKNREQRWVVL